MDDRTAVAAQIGRPPRSRVDVVARCPLDLPVVTVVPPLLDDGTPFPTRYWLTCPLAVLRTSRMESTGGIRRAEAALAADPGLAERHERAMARYAADRDAALPPDHTGPRPRGGVAGATGGVKCLHAHLADHLAGNDNPIGSWVAAEIGELVCDLPCVLPGGEGRNPEWREPPR